MEGKITRCKFVCEAITKKQGWGGAQFIYDAQFRCVQGKGGTTEDEKFFAATPSGQLSVGTVAQDVFEVGKAYYLDIIEAPAGA